MARSRAALLKRINRLAQRGVQGTLVERYLTCGTKTCGCHLDPQRRHGPHLSLKFKTREGKSTGLYVPRSHEGEVREAAAAWDELWDALVELAELNRDELHARIRSRDRGKR
jgi:hypothetical protein